jgi:hypothetical protein
MVEHSWMLLSALKGDAPAPPAATAACNNITTHIQLLHVLLASFKSVGCIQLLVLFRVLV